MKIAVLAFYGRPKRFISSNRIYGLIRGLSKLGLEVHFFTAPTFLPPDDCFEVSPLCKGVTEFSAIPIPLCFYTAGRKIIQRVVVRNLVSEFSDGGQGKRQSSNHLLQKLWNWRYASPIFRDNTQTGGFFILKRITEHRLLRYIQEHDVQVLFTSHAPPIAHEFGLNLKKRLGPRLYWIADFRDPMIDKYALVEYSEKLARIEREVLRTADLITTVSHSMIEDMLDFAQNESIQIAKNKFFCLYNGFFEMPGILTENNLWRKAEGKLRISYTGTIFQGKHDLSALFAAVSKLSEGERSALEFIYAGPQVDFVRDLASKYHLQSICHIMGVVAKEMALHVQSNSDILLLLKGETGRGVFTGKFFEYLFSGKPILVVGDKDDEFNDVAMQVGGVRIVPKGHKGSQQILEILRSLLSASSLQSAVEAEFGRRRMEEINKFHWDFLSRCLYERITQG